MIQVVVYDTCPHMPILGCIRRQLAVSVQCALGLVLAVAHVGQFVAVLDASIVNVAHHLSRGKPRSCTVRPGQSGRGSGMGSQRVLTAKYGQ